MLQPEKLNFLRIIERNKSLTRAEENDSYATTRKTKFPHNNREK